LAFTKTYAMAAAAGLSVTLIPVLIVAFVRGRVADENANPLNRSLMAAYRPVIRAVLDNPGTTIGTAATTGCLAR
jgi:Cu(I)/Ag(I) efflux system membrane protein CusA/SilA